MAADELAAAGDTSFVRMQLPIATIQSGPVNSLRGAAALTGLSDAIVLDIGKPTSPLSTLSAARTAVPSKTLAILYSAGS